MSNLKDKYNKEVVPALEQKLETKNRMLVPRLLKVVLNMGFGIVSKDEQKNLMGDLATITGQKPKVCKAKKSISNFKLREGMVITGLRAAHRLLVLVQALYNCRALLGIHALHRARAAGVIAVSDDHGVVLLDSCDTHDSSP